MLYLISRPLGKFLSRLKKLVLQLGAGVRVFPEIINVFYLGVTKTSIIIIVIEHVYLQN